MQTPADVSVPHLHAAWAASQGLCRAGLQAHEFVYPKSSGVFHKLYSEHSISRLKDYIYKNVDMREIFPMGF